MNVIAAGKQLMIKKVETLFSSVTKAAAAHQLWSNIRS
jgi:hypothetical protein|tara:strand:+ start:218 stop:331 length:114 start_codon:yes stop_codon:yes gene_type:complete